MMSTNDTWEQADFKTEVKSLQQEIQEQERQADNIEQFIYWVHKNIILMELTHMHSERL